MAHDDPFDWSIDRVVNEICRSQSPSWAAGADIKLIVNPESLEQTLKDNDIDGDNLLALEDENLRIDLGVASFGQRRRLRNIIHQLRSISLKYQTRLRAHSSTSTSLQTFDTSQLSHNNAFTPSRSSPDHLGLGVKRTMENIDTTDQNQTLDRDGAVERSPHVDIRALGSPYLDQPSVMRNTGDLFSQYNSGEPPAMNAASNLSKSGVLPQAAVTLTDNLPFGSAFAQNTVATKLQNNSILNNLDDMIDQELHTNVASNTSKGLDHGPGDSSSRQSEKRKKPTKRAVLIPVQDGFSSSNNIADIQSEDVDMNITGIKQSQPAPKESSNESDIEAGHSHKRVKLVHDAYIPHKPFSGSRISADTVVYNKADRVENNAVLEDIGSKDNNDMEFAFLRTGSNQVKHHQFRMSRTSKRLVHSALRTFTGDFSKEHTSLSEPLGHMPSDFEHDAGSAHVVARDLPADLQALLKKYPATEGDGLFPLYGDSDEEDRMMTPEWETPPAAEQSSTKNALTREEIDSIIDRTFEEFRENWRQRQLSKVQARAHSRWTAAARNKILHSRMLMECQKLLSRSQKRVVDHRSGIHCSEWRKAEDVEQQCLAIEVSVHQVEEYSHYVKVLEDESEPTRPVRTLVKKPRAPRSKTVFSNGDEDLGSESDDHDSFIVDDGDEPAAQNMDAMSLDEASHTWSPRFNDQQGVERRRQSALPGIEACSEVSTDVDPGDIPIETIGETAGRTDAGNSSHDIQVIDIDSNDESPSETRRVKLKKEEASKEAKRNPISIPRLTDSSEYDSDFERPPRLPSTKFRKSGKSIDKAIDLTRSSSVALSDSNNGNTSDFEVRTPKLETNNTFELSTRSRVSQEPTSSSRKTQDKRMDALVYDVQRVRGTNWVDVEPDIDEPVVDGRLALAKCIYEASSRSNQLLDDFVRSLRTMDDFEDVLQAGMLAVKEDSHEIISIDRKNQQNARYLTELFLSYVLGRNIVDDDDMSESEIDDAYALLSDGVPTFHALVTSLLKHIFQFQSQGSSHTPLGNNPRSTSKDSDTQDTDEDLRQSHPSKFRKRKVEQSKAAAMQQRADQNRVKRQEEMRAELAKQQAALGLDKDITLTAINTEAPLVYLDRQIAARAKPHQISGIQFMWREIVNDPKQQGCLLAHTMGLGKTMQVVSLLVTIAQCKISPDPAIRALIPDHLKENRTMILCPTSLIENWEEEFAKWMPADPQGRSLVGNVITLTNKIRAPATTIDGWIRSGGVLILSYDRFRLYTNPPKNTKVQRDNPEQTRKNLLEGANIVIADEAHQLKNAKSKVAQSAGELETWSRISLTGSPLNNYLEEYHTMINWIAPGYLGSLVQFRAKYVEPINQGLYADSSGWERKASLKKLHILKKNIAPKTHRADITAIAKDLPPKTEFFITIALTEDQTKAYQLYVRELRNMPAAPGTKKHSAPKVWHWLNVLSLLLNHPSCFIEKLKQREQAEQQAEQAVKAQSGNTDGNEDGYDSGGTNNSADEVNLQEQPELVSAMQKVVDVFTEAKVLYRIEDPSLSHKSLLIKNILEEAAKLGEKTLIFSQSIPTLNYYETMLQGMKLAYKRIDGQKKAGDRFTRQEHVDQFNKSDHYKVFLISTRAGGLGLNIQSATRVIINDFGFNPTWEQQAIGRAYRIGQKKPVYVYRFLTGGTFDELIHNKAVFKSQLFTRVIDEKNVSRLASKSPGEYLFDPKEVAQKNFDECLGKDPNILDRILQRVDCVRDIVLTETFMKDDEEELTEQELKEANEELELEQLERDDPAEFARRMQAKRAQELREALEKQRNAAAAVPSASQPVGQTMTPSSHYFNPVIGPPAGYSAASFAQTLAHPAFAAVAHGARDGYNGFDDLFMFTGDVPGVASDPNSVSGTGFVSAFSPRRQSVPQIDMLQPANVSSGNSARPIREAAAARSAGDADHAGNSNGGDSDKDPSSASGCRSQ